MEKRSIQEDFAFKIAASIAALLSDDKESHLFINIKDVEENPTDFIYAVSCLVPAIIHNKITNENKTLLEINHLANQLIFQNKK